MSHAPREAGACRCGRLRTIVEILDAASAFDPSLGLVAGRCPHCDEAFEAQPHAGGLRLGYTYFGGSMHFEATAELSDRALVVGSPRPDELTVQRGARSWRFAAHEDKVQWMAILGGSASEGKTVAELRLEDLGVRATEFERPRFHPMPFSPETVLQLGDRLLVKGRHSALRRAWARIHEGR